MRLIPALAALVLARLGATAALAGEPAPAPLATVLAPPAVALLHTEASSPLIDPRVAAFDSLLFAELSARPEIILVEREELGAALGEFHLQSRAAADPANAVRIGRWTGARIIVSARATARGPGLSVAARILSVDTGGVLVADAAMDAPSAFASGAKCLADRIATIIVERSAPLLPSPDEEAARLEALRTSLDGRPPRTITLAARETRSAVSPSARFLAAEEIARLWKAAGGLVEREPGAAAPAGSLVVRVDARAEPGLRHGEFAVARGHVSIVVLDPASSRELLRDRQTEIALDASDSRALDIALQKAASALTFRLLRDLPPQARP